MPRNGSGSYSLPAGNPVVTGTTISSTVQNNTMSDVATALTNSIAKDGQTTPTANLPMGNFKLTGLGTGSAATDSANLTQIQAQAYILLGAVAGTDTITGTTNPVTTAYATGQTYRFVAAGANTGAVTLNVNSLGAKAITKNGATALVSGDIVSGGVYQVTYDGTQFQITNVSLVTIPADSVTAASLADSALGAAMVNGTLTAAVGSSALTIAIKTKAGTDPSATDPVLIYFRNATAATGDYTVISLTAATSFVVSSGSALGTTDGVANRLWVIGFNDGGTFRLGAVNLSTSIAVGDDVLGSSTAEGGAGAADSAGVIYTGTAVTSKAMRILGYVESTQATAGTWATPPSKIQLYSEHYDTKVPTNISTIVSGTPVASTSGTSIDFTGIPSWAKRITIMFSGVSTNGTSPVICQIGDSGGIETSGYLGCVQRGTNFSAYSASFLLEDTAAATTVRHGSIILSQLSSSANTWTISGVMAWSDLAFTLQQGGAKSLSSTLTQVRITTVGGANTFDAGTINILYE